MTCAGGIQKGSQSRGVRLKVVPVFVWDEVSGRSCGTYGFLDEGSNATMCTNELVNRLGVKGDKLNYSLSTVSGTSERQGVRVSLTVRGISEAQVICLKDVIAVPKLPDLENSIPTVQDIEDYPYLSSIQFQELESPNIELLIGADVQSAYKISESCEGHGGPLAVHTGLGRTLLGAVEKLDDCELGVVQVHFVQTQREMIHEQMQNLYDADFRDLDESSGKLAYSVEDRKTVRIMEESVIKTKGHYQVALPWRDPDVELPNNRAVALKSS